MNSEFSSMCALYNFGGANDSISQAALSMSGGMSPGVGNINSMVKSNITKTGMSGEQSIGMKMTDSRESF